MAQSSNLPPTSVRESSFFLPAPKGMHLDQDIIDILKIKASTKTLSSGQDKPSPQLPESLPILGLADIVIFPGMVAPLLIESTASGDLIDDVVSGDRFIGLVLQTSPVDDPSPDDLHACGCLARVQKMVKQPNQQVRILIEGIRRFRTLEFSQTSPYLKASVDYHDESEESGVEAKALARNTKKLFQELLEHAPTLNDQFKSTNLNTDQPSKMADLIGANLNLKLEQHQQLLSLFDVKERYRTLLPMLQHELELQTIGARIQKETSSSISKSQKDFYLKEQLRVIQRELGEEDASASDIRRLQEGLDQAALPEETREVAMRELDRLRSMASSLPDYGVTRHYLEWLVDLPWQARAEDHLDLNTASKILDEQHFGLGKVKNRLLEYLAVLKLTGTMRGPILCLVGPPGVGKTSLGRSIADAMGRPFARIALGGVRDEAEIRGHRRTYVGAMPGRLLQTLKRLKARNPVILLDEVDKLGSDFRGDPASALLEVLDPQQNKHFSDHYLEVPFDLSDILFITTANWLDPVHPALRDRLEVIELSSYTTSEKVQIARTHLIPKLLQDHGLPPRSLKIPLPILRLLVEQYTREAGVRQLERTLASVLRKVAREGLESGKSLKTHSIDADWIHRQLGAATHPQPEHEVIAEHGLALGLGWTPSGGDILFMEATCLPGSGKLILTGSLGDVMKESAQAALTYLRSQAAAMNLELPPMDTHDIHLHVPAGATPKDGPSAGICLFAALASLFMKRKLSSRLAMTGEISLRGRVLPVGGIREKLLAAARGGVKEVVLPDANRRAWEEIPAEIQKRLKIHWIRHVEELMPILFGQGT